MVSVFYTCFIFFTKLVISYENTFTLSSMISPFVKVLAKAENSSLDFVLKTESDEFFSLNLG